MKKKTNSLLLQQDKTALATQHDMTICTNFMTLNIDEAIQVTF